MRSFLLAGLLAASTPAAAEVVSANSNGFEVNNAVNLVIPVSQAYAAFSRLGTWWNDEHTYSGKAANIQLTLRPGGCFCESIPTGGGVDGVAAVPEPTSAAFLAAGAALLLRRRSRRSK